MKKVGSCAGMASSIGAGCVSTRAGSGVEHTGASRGGSARGRRRERALVGLQRHAGTPGTPADREVRPANGNWLYVGLTPNDRNDPQASDDGQGNDQPILNPITGKMEWNGTAIVNIDDPGEPEVRVAHPERGGARQLALGLVVYDYGFDSNPRARLPHSQLGHGKKFKFEIWDITTAAPTRRRFPRSRDHGHAAEQLRTRLRRHVHPPRA
jgi:hypothetical protein